MTEKKGGHDRGTSPYNFKKVSPPPRKQASIYNSPVSHSARHQRPARERHKIGIALRENVDNQAPQNTNFTH